VFRKVKTGSFQAETI